MNPEPLRLAHKLFGRGSLRRVRRAVARRLARYVAVPGNPVTEYRWVLNPDRPAHLASRKSQSLRINWIVPGIGPALGGWFNIIRAIKQFEEWGHENRLYVLGGIPGSAEHAKELINKSYFVTNAEIHPLVEPISDAVKDSDALIATSWPTAYAARAIANTARKYYFIQDLEYMFYAPGSLHTFAQNTYKFGFRGITAGSWIADVLKSDFNMQCTPFGFSYDREAYSRVGERMLASGKKRVLFYARPETERRGFELGILTLSQVAKLLPDVEFVLAGFPHDSLDVPFKVVLPGVLSLSRLGALYRSCDVALVLSHTNLSLLPLELMACGCVVVSNSGPNTEWLLNHKNSRLAGPDPVSLAEAVIAILQNEEERKRLAEDAFAFADSTHWVKEIRVIESALNAGFDEITEYDQAAIHV
jgi:O-antigen biosynthesis protein